MRNSYRKALPFYSSINSNKSRLVSLFASKSKWYLKSLIKTFATDLLIFFPCYMICLSQGPSLLENFAGDKLLFAF